MFIHQKDFEAFKQKLNTLDEWKTTLDHELPKHDRVEIVKAFKEWKLWIKVSATILGLIFVGGGVSVIALLNSMSHKADQLNQNLEKKVAEEFNDLSLEKKIVATCIQEASTAFRQESTEAFAASAASLTAYCKVMLKSQMESSRVAGGGYQPLNLRESALLIEDLERRYFPKFKQFKGHECLAYIACVNGILERSSGNQNKAIAWFNHARRADPNFPEARLLLGIVYADDIVYEGDFSFSKDYTQQSSSYLQQAVLLLGPETPAGRFAICRALATNVPFRVLEQLSKPHAKLSQLEMKIPSNADALTQADLEAAEDYINNQIRASDMGEPDPRLEFWRGQILIQLAGKVRPLPESQRIRKDAVYCYKRALKADSSFIRALNNLVWWASHGEGDGDGLKYPTDFDAQGTYIFRSYLEWLEADPLCSTDFSILNTVSEAYAALCLRSATSMQTSLEQADEKNVSAWKNDAWKAQRYAQKAVTLSAYTDDRQHSYFVKRQKLIDDEINPLTAIADRRMESFQKNPKHP